MKNGPTFNNVESVYEVLSFNGNDDHEICKFQFILIVCESLNRQFVFNFWNIMGIVSKTLNKTLEELFIVP